MADLSMVKTAPTSEKGSQTGIPVLGLMTWAALGQQVGNDLEYVPELMWPNSVFTYQKQRNDSQVDGLLNGVHLPIRMWDWGIDPNGAPPEVVQELSRDLGLPIAERNGATWRIAQDPIPRRQTPFDFDEHLADALLANTYGHNYFEMNADLIEPPANWPVDTPLRARLRKLAIRPPWTLIAIDTDVDGGLSGIRQLHQPITEPPIPVTQLVAYVWGKEGANWVGRSMLRSCYRPWLIKDRIMRVGAINIERNGAGVPVITAPPGATVGQIKMLEDLARRVRAGESSGGSIPNGASLQLMGVIGSQPDAVAFMNYLDQEMARAFMQMVQQLGQTATGSRALGRTFLDMMEWLLESVANWFVAVFNKIVIERWMQWNFGAVTDSNAASFAPRLVYVKRGSATDVLNQQVSDGSLNVDQATADQLAGNNTNSGTNNSTQASRRSAGGHDGRSVERRAAGEVTESQVPLPARPLRREPNAHEIAASVDFATMDNTFQAALDLVTADVRSLIRYQVDELHDAIVEANGDLDAIMEISASPQHSEVIRSQLVQVATRAATEASQEAMRQGISAPVPNLDDLLATLADRSQIADTMITREVNSAAIRRAVRMTGGTLEPNDVANQVRDELNAMTWQATRDILSGAVQGAQNSARALYFRRDGHDGELYSSEILDDRTCDNCEAIDGQTYASLDDAERDYPFGGYVDCLGGGRCRGTVVKVYSTETVL